MGAYGPVRLRRKSAIGNHPLPQFCRMNTAISSPTPRVARHMLPALLSACTFCAPPRAARAVVPPRAVSPLMASWTAADMKMKRLKLPEEVRTHARCF